MRVPEEEVIQLDGLPGPSMLASANVHGLLFFPIAFGIGWAKLSSLAVASSLEYGRYELDDAVTSVLAVGGPGEKWLLAANGQAIYIFDIALLASDPVSYSILFKFFILVDIL